MYSQLRSCKLTALLKPTKFLLFRYLELTFSKMYNPGVGTELPACTCAENPPHCEAASQLQVFHLFSKLKDLQLPILNRDQAHCFVSTLIVSQRKLMGGTGEKMIKNKIPLFWSYKHISSCRCTASCTYIPSTFYPFSRRCYPVKYTYLLPWRYHGMTNVSKDMNHPIRHLQELFTLIFN